MSRVDFEPGEVAQLGPIRRNRHKIWVSTGARNLQALPICLIAQKHDSALSRAQIRLHNVVNLPKKIILFPHVTCFQILALFKVQASVCTLHFLRVRFVRIQWCWPNPPYLLCVVQRLFSVCVLLLLVSQEDSSAISSTSVIVSCQSPDPSIHPSNIEILDPNPSTSCPVNTHFIVTGYLGRSYYRYYAVALLKLFY